MNNSPSIESRFPYLYIDGNINHTMSNAEVRRCIDRDVESLRRSAQMVRNETGGGQMWDDIADELESRKADFAPHLPSAIERVKASRK